VQRAVFHHPHLTIALDDLSLNFADLTFSLIKSRQSFFPAMMASRASFTQPGQSESVWRGKPNVGLDFSHDLRRGLSDHCGVTEGFGLRLLKY